MRIVRPPVARSIIDQHLEEHVGQLDIFSLEGRVALIPGGSGGIGSALAEAFAGAGARVAIAGRSRETADAVDIPGGGVIRTLITKPEFDRIVDRRDFRQAQAGALPGQSGRRLPPGRG